MREGWIKLHRKISSWEWYDEPNTKSLFLHLLLHANWKDKQWRGMTIKRGDFLTSIKKLSDELGITYQSIRTCLKHLQSTGDITVKPTNKFSVITVTNYEGYNNSDDEDNMQTNSPDNSLANSQLTTTKKDKKKRSKRTTTKGFVPPDLDMVKDYIKHNNLNVNAFTFMRFFQCAEPPWTDSNGKAVRNWKQKLITWSDGRNTREGKTNGRNARNEGGIRKLAL